jgi:protein O-GlcNAc transferase
MSSTDPLERSSGLIRSGDLSAAGAIAQGLLAQGRFSEAEAVFRQLCAADPANARGWLGLGRALDRQKKPAEASDAFQRACDLAPDSGEAQRLLGACKLRDGATLEALRCFERAVAAEPANAMHHAALANAYQQLNDHRATLTHFARAVELAPQSAPLFSTYLFELSHHPELSPEHVFAEHVRYGKTFGGLGDRARHTARPDPNRRLRIGYVSGDFYRHTAMLFLVPVLRQHDRRRFEIFAYANVFRPDEGTREISALVQHWRLISGLSDDAAAAQILNDRIDVLVDLSGHTDSNRLPVFARKPAPVQVSWLGYPATTGLTEIDYKIANWATKPERQAFYVEKVYRMPGAAACFNPPIDIGPPGPPPALANGFVTFGSFNAPRKMSLDVLDVWAAILRQLPASRLMLKYTGLQDAERCRPLVEAFLAHGVTADRLAFEGHSPFAEHLRAYDQIDIALDPFPYSGGTTTRNALWSGVPVIALDDPVKIGSISAGALKLVGLDACVAETTQDYVSCAVAVASDVARLAGWRGEIRGKLAASDYFDARKFTRALESAFIDMWETWQRGRS